MNRGLVIGKFMPPHKGHLGLIDFGARNCDLLTVAVCSSPNEPISGNLRYQWMKELVGPYKNINLVEVKADLPQDKKPSRRASKIWSDYLLKRLGKIDIVFSSEIYGDYLAEFMGAEHKLFDLDRKREKVSATRIRNKPFKYWKFIPNVAQPYFVKKICIYGPESTGKTILAEQLARHYKTLWVPEFAREYIAKHKNKFSYNDIEKFSIGQLQLEESAVKEANKLLFCDTDFITTVIYSRHYFGKCPAFTKKLANRKRYDLYLFADIDIPWVFDPQRDLGSRRKEFRKIFLKELISRKIPFMIVGGKGKKRFLNAIKAVNNFIKKFC